MLVEIVCEEDVVSTVFQDLSRNQKLVFFQIFICLVTHNQLT